MKTSLPHLRRLSAVLVLCAVAASAGAAPADRAAAALARHGSLPLVAAGPHVAPGTFQIQVAAKLGRPDDRLADGTWLYHHHRVEASDAEGTLVVRFGADRRVSSLSLATAAVVASLRANPVDGAGRLAAK
ncbi:MAG: hypothetical protein HZC55_28430 [Verrucomicrobia bacterium]|nr:hypothetical protein [Verrucomicrobiota bacterium]